MANSTAGQLASWFGSPGMTAHVSPTRTTAGARGPGWSGRLAGSLIGAAGTLSISGSTESGNVGVSRRVVIMTQPPAPQIIAEVVTPASTGVFAFPNLPAGQYTVIDFMDDGSKQALIYDHVVAG